jgi:hypothetical protein
VGDCIRSFRALSWGTQPGEAHSERRSGLGDMSAETTTRGDALDLLEEEDLELRRLFTQLRTIQGASVAERAEYGDLTKTTIRLLATREAAITEVVGVVRDVPDWRTLPLGSRRIPVSDAR